MQNPTGGASALVSQMIVEAHGSESDEEEVEPEDGPQCVLIGPPANKAAP